MKIASRNAQNASARRVIRPSLRTRLAVIATMRPADAAPIPNFHGQNITSR